MPSDSELQCWVIDFSKGCKCSLGEIVGQNNSGGSVAVTQNSQVEPCAFSSGLLVVFTRKPQQLPALVHGLPIRIQAPFAAAPVGLHRRLAAWHQHRGQSLPWQQRQFKRPPQPSTPGASVRASAPRSSSATLESQAVYEASLRGFTPSTLAQYFRCVRVFLAFARALDILGQLVHIVDLMHACDSSKAEDRTSVRISPQAYAQGSFVARPDPLTNPLVRAFASPQHNHERKEALGVLAAWEQKVCSADCTPSLRIALGFLLAAHTSVRFGDFQRFLTHAMTQTRPNWTHALFSRPALHSS